MARVDYGEGKLSATLLIAGCRASGRSTMMDAVRRRVAAHRIVGDGSGDEAPFDWLVLDLGRVGGWQVAVRLIAVPSLAAQADVRRTLIGEADGIVLVADSLAGRIDDNIETIRQLQEDLIAGGVDPRDIPQVYLYSKQDLPADLILPVETLDSTLNFRSVPSRGGDLTRGTGVVESVQRLVSLVMSRHAATPSRDGSQC